MTPLGLAVAGLLLVLFDLNVAGPDLLPDALGWPLAAVGFHRVAPRSRWFAAAATGAWLGLLAWLAQVAGAETWGSVLEAVALTVVAFGACTALRALVADEVVRRRADLLRWSDLALSVPAVVLMLAGEELATDAGDGLGGLVLVLVLLALSVHVLFLLLLWSNRRRAELGAACQGEGTLVGRSNP